VTRPPSDQSALPHSSSVGEVPDDLCTRHLFHALRPMGACEDVEDRVRPTARPDRVTTSGDVEQGRRKVHEGHSFEVVESVLSNPFLPGIDPVHIRLPALPRVRSTEDDEAHLLRYWQVHLWETLLRYRRAFGNPACTERIRAGYPDVDEAALWLAHRATSGFPLAPIDSVDCHSALKVLKADVTSLETTVSALANGSSPFHPME